MFWFWSTINNLVSSWNSDQNSHMEGIKANANNVLISTIWRRNASLNCEHKIKENCRFTNIAVLLSSEMTCDEHKGRCLI